MSIASRVFDDLLLSDLKLDFELPRGMGKREISIDPALLYSTKEVLNQP